MNLMSFESSKIVGGVAALLLFCSLFISFLVFYAGVIIGFTSIILILFSLLGLSRHYQNVRISKFALIGTVVGIIGITIAVVFAAVVFLPSAENLMYQIDPGWSGDWNSPPSMAFDVDQLLNNFDLSVAYAVFLNMAIIAVILLPTAIIATYFIRQSLKQLSENSNISLFGTTGTLLLIGAFLSIIAIGLILIWIAALLLALSFLQLKPPTPTAYT
ncbi:MAG: DUF996 domain-containing protein [Nitrososphaerota archaeon]|jgi:uncharacterized membrane protein|nr:DUF996 domain-containing protein [Nitrososphaerota archaeon]